jgi:hypothetical protein
VNPLYKAKYTLNKKDKLFVAYADNIKKMIQSAADNQSKLLSVINDLFSYTTDPYSGKRVIRVNPKLTDELLQKAVEKSRRFIVDLYVKCENDYVNGIKIYEAIVESKILETTQKQIETLKLEASKIIDDTKKTVAHVPVTINQLPMQPPVAPVAPVQPPMQQPQVASVQPVAPPLASVQPPVAPVQPPMQQPQVASVQPVAPPVASVQPPVAQVQNNII